MSTRITLVWTALSTLLALGGCSAIVQPDPARLGGIDSGSPDTTDAWVDRDAGAGTDAGRDPDGGPVCPPSCADTFACTTDRCEDGVCVHDTDDSLCPPEERCSPTLGCVPQLCATDEQCNDGNLCDGTERCVPGSGTATGCVEGPPLDCNDGATCTLDSCVNATGCVHAPMHDACNDSVPCTRDVCSGTAGPTGCENTPDHTMCNDGCQMGGVCGASGCSGALPRVCADDGNPCTVESCSLAMGGCMSTPLDADGDGYPAARVGPTTCAGGTDCDDTRGSVNPGATEMCGNGIDDDCNPATSDVCAGTPGDTCASALPITLSGSSGSVRVSLDGMRNDYSTSCGGSGGNDAVYYFDVPTTSEVRIETSGSVDTVIASALSCNADAFRDRCNDDRDSGVTLTSRIWLRPVTVPFGGAPVRVYVLLDQYRVASGEVTLTVTLTSQTPNSCPTGGSSNPLTISGGGTVLGNVTGGTGGMRGSCQPAVTLAPEALFRIEEADRELEMLTAHASSFVPDLYVLSGGCARGTEVACTRGTASGSGGTAMLEDTDGTGGSTTFYVAVDNASIGGGEYRLTYDP